MKVSRYTFLFEDNAKCYAYNTLSNALVEIDNEIFAVLKNSVNKNRDCLCDIGEDVLIELKNNKIVTDNDLDDFLIYKKIILNQRFQTKVLNLTIAPTMDCCFTCHYCFEKYKDKTYISKSIMENIIKYIKWHKEADYLNITWFGGEPLLAIDQIDVFYDLIRRECPSMKLSSCMITSGFNLDAKAIEIIRKNKISSLQITIDGLKETHNMVKFTAGCEDAFSKTFENIDLLTTLAPETYVVIRVNITKSNSEEFAELSRFVYGRYAGKKVSIGPAMVLDRNGCCQNNDGLFNRDSFSNYLMGLAKIGIPSPQVQYPSQSMCECAIRNSNSMAFDPNGYAYKCWEHIGDIKYRIGKLSDDGTILGVDEVLLNRVLYGADPLCDEKCSNCKYLPICNGGCPIQRIENEYNGAHNDICSCSKKHLIESIKLGIPTD